jgi:phthalate 4,5-cis-dihydrodiol dehydrogenase
MALSLEQTDAMNEAAAKSGRLLMAGHTQSYSLPIRAMRKIVKSGKIGKLYNQQAMAYTDWMLRPRSDEELDPNQGGGIPWRQTPHQVDSVRLIGGGLVKTVRGSTATVGGWRPIAGFYSAFMEFEDGSACHIVHNGYGYFLASELLSGSDSGSRYTAEQRGALRKAMKAGARDEEADKQAMRIGGEANERTFGVRTERRPWNPGDLGIVIVNTEHGAIRHSPYGVYVYDDDGLHDVDLTGGAATGGVAGRRGELEEFHETIVSGSPLFHDGRWGAATLEVALGIMQSARESKDIQLKRQVAVPDWYDKDLSVPYLD